MMCADWHMPWQPSKDEGNVNGFVHSHRFPGANTAVPTANEDAAQLKLTEDFLKSGALTVDIFALSPAQAPLKPGATTQSDLSTTFAVGEEAESKVTAETSGEGGEQDHAAGAIVLPEIRVVWNAGSLRWIARPDETECSFSGLRRPADVVYSVAERCLGEAGENS